MEARVDIESGLISIPIRFDVDGNQGVAGQMFRWCARVPTCRGENFPVYSRCSGLEYRGQRPGVGDRASEIPWGVRSRVRYHGGGDKKQMRKTAGPL